jgi:DNA-directed RNA polymerase subunit beta'
MDHELRIKLLSPEKMLSLSHGEVKNNKTVHAVTRRPEPEGLFDCKIFGPVDDYSCICGSIRRNKKKEGLICGKCGVEVTSSLVRRQRMGHIVLAAPVVHVWFQSLIATLLNIPRRKLEEIIYCDKFIVIESNDEKIKEGDLIDFAVYAQNKDKIKAFTGGMAIHTLLKDIDLEKLSKKLKEETPSRRINRRLSLIRDLINSGNKPEWMVLTVLPVLPPDLRPVLFMYDGTVASSDLNELYSRVISRNKRLKRFIEMKSPELIFYSECKLVQIAVDCLFDNGKKHTAKNTSGKRALKSLTETISSKEGRFRKNLLGKRVDYSGRSQIVVGPDLKLHQAGIPKLMALELFKPFIYNRLIEKGYASSIQHAQVIIKKMLPEAIESLQEVVKEHPVILNRAPTLHKLSMQAFEPVIVEGKAIRLHPLVCSGFNADFDGDQMGVHIPLSFEAQIEARLLMGSVNNLLHPATGNPAMPPSQDIVLGLYWLTKERAGEKGEGMIFSGVDEVLIAYENNVIEEHSIIKVKINNEIVQTTTGRVLLSEILPAEISFSEINNPLTKKDIGKLVEACYKKAGPRRTVLFLDGLKEIGFKHATNAGISLCMDDMHIPSKKNEIIRNTEEEVGKINHAYESGLVSAGERYNKIIDLWKNSTEEVAEEMMKEFGVIGETGLSPEEIEKQRQFNSVFMMADSGARGSIEQLKQVAGMRGLMVKTTGEIIETPIKSNFKEGLSAHEFFLSAHGARKGRADGALKTANAGYFTRRLVDAAHDVIVTEQDCGGMDGLKITSLIENRDTIESLSDRIIGRFTSALIVHPATGKLILGRNTGITEDAAAEILNAGIESVLMRSPITCRSKTGICAMCYGRDLSTGQLVEIGTAVGIIAAQSIGEPGTQLTLRTFHSGGSAAGSGAQTIIECKSPGAVSFSGIKTISTQIGDVVIKKGIISIPQNGGKAERYDIPYGSVLYVKDGQKVDAAHKIAEWDPFSVPIVAEEKGVVQYKDFITGVSVKDEVDDLTGLSRKTITASDLVPFIVIESEDGSRSYPLPTDCHVLVQDYSPIEKGDLIAKTPLRAAKNIDITSGLPKVIELIEAKKPKHPALLAEISGLVKITGPNNKIRILSITAEDDSVREHLVKGNSLINAHDGDYLNAGDVIVDGVINPHDMMRLLGVHQASIFILNEVQKVYKSQGVSINPKHFEIILKKMAGMVRIISPGVGSFITGDIVSRSKFLSANEQTKGLKGIAQPILLGITQIAMLSPSFVSAASFQRTASVLARAAFSGSHDSLEGVKENIIIGGIIPVGTGRISKNEGIIS